MTSERVRARVFGEVADEYERLRPGYPPELISDVLTYADLGGRPALEVGAGTGKATRAFAGHGIRITAVEPDPAMLAVLRERLAGQPNVSSVLSSFEEYSPTEPFGLLYCAQAWHWVDPVRGWELAADALTPGGAVAVFWNDDTFADPAHEALLASAFQRHAPHLGFTPGHPDSASRATGPGADLREQPRFRDVETRVYHWQRQLSTVDFVALLGTQSAFVLLDPAVRDSLFGELIRDLPERLELAMVTVLHLGRRG